MTSDTTSFSFLGTSVFLPRWFVSVLSTALFPSDGFLLSSLLHIHCILLRTHFVLTRASFFTFSKLPGCKSFLSHPVLPPFLISTDASTPVRGQAVNTKMTKACGISNILSLIVWFSTCCISASKHRHVLFPYFVTYSGRILRKHRGGHQSFHHRKSSY
ncbi:hypothetical protein MPH_11095 [Macrophomina phaseolina MS6]|uniref:Uncharacterized protein n=1 Tax=Macrophomina phaseolina (strain MS6) TaxID=1126212 RepID=K2RFH6_MACPH|nr:hypothetical protein MPH_11095 [Macrophomina phaseolina MS6]